MIPNTSAIDLLTEKAVAAMKTAVARVVEDHRRRGKPLAVWRDGRVVQEFFPAAEHVREAVEDYRPDKKLEAPDDSGEEKEEPAR